MVSFLESSIVVRFILSIFVIFTACYDKSNLKKIFHICKQSKTYNLFKSYADKKPYYTHSLIYKIIKGVHSFLDKLCDSVNDFFAKYLNGSFVIDNVNKVLSNYESFLYVIAWYVFLDFGIRTYIPRFGGVWDELLFVLLAMVAVIKYIAYKKSRAIKIAPLDLPIIIFVSTMTFILIVQSPDRSISFEGYRATWQNILWYFIVLWLLKDRRGAKNLCVMFVFAAFLIAVHGVYQYIIGVDMPSNWIDRGEMAVRTRVFSIIGSPNILGSLMVLAIPISTSFMLMSKNLKGKIFLAGVTVTLLSALVFSFSRGAWMGFAASAAMYALLKDKRLIIPVIVMGMISVALVPSIGDRILYMLSPEYIESSLRGGRLVRWFTGLEILGSTPSNLIVGTGLGHFGGAVAMNRGITRLVGTDIIKTFYMDNYYLKTAVETGLIGLAAFMILMYQVVICSYRTIRETKSKSLKTLEIGILSGLIGIIVHNLVENVFEVPMISTYFWMLTAVMMHLWFFTEKHTEGEAHD